MHALQTESPVTPDMLEPVVVEGNRTVWVLARDVTAGRDLDILSIEEELQEVEADRSVLLDGIRHASTS